MPLLSRARHASFSLRRQDLLHSQATLFIICGLPGAGKTTLAKHIESSLSAVRMSADDWMTALSINLHAEEQRAQIEALQWELARRLLSLGQNVVIEWGAWGKSERDEFRTQARALGARVELYYLSASLQELFARIQQRNLEDPPIEWAKLQEWAAIFQVPTPAEMKLFDAHSWSQ
jgi:predicted kinase